MQFSRRQLLNAAAAGTAAITTRASAGAPSTLAPGKFIKSVGDIEMYCEVSGRGPLLIVQTGMWVGVTITDRYMALDQLASHFTVLTFDARGQGRTTYGKGRGTYGRLAADTVRLMDVLDIERAHFFGHSDGGCIELELLLNFDDRVTSATLSGTPYSHQAYAPAVRAAFENWRRAMIANSDRFTSLEGVPVSEADLRKIQDRYASFSPNPERFLDAMKDQRRCWATEPDFSLSRLSAIRRPVLVLCAGRDPYIPLSAFNELHAAIPNAVRCDLPDMTHDVSASVSKIIPPLTKFVATASA